jgi:hypothetical protein
VKMQNGRRQVAAGAANMFTRPMQLDLHARFELRGLQGRLV